MYLNALSMLFLLSLNTRIAMGQTQLLSSEKRLAAIRSKDNVTRNLSTLDSEETASPPQGLRQGFEPDGFRHSGLAAHTSASPSADDKQPAWVRYYSSGLLPGSDSATDLMVDLSGNICVTGKSEGAGTGYDFVTLKYSSSGQQEWVARLAGPGIAVDIPTALAIDSLGNVYVTGISDDNYLTVKYSPNGKEEWTATYAGPATGEGSPAFIGIDKAGNVYVAGISYSSDNSSDYTTIKYSPGGKELWVARYNEAATSVEYLSAVALDDFGNVYISGTSRVPGDYYSTVTIKYDSTGKVLWLAFYEGKPLQVVDMQVDHAGNCYLLGYRVASTNRNKYITIKYDPNGKMQWERLYDYPDWIEMPAALAIDSAGSVIVTGTSLGRDSLDTYATVKYTSDGELQWISRSSSDDQAKAIAVGASGNIYILGRSRMAKYDSHGNEKWLIQTGVESSALGIDGQENIFVAGSRNGDLVVLSHDENSSEQWCVSYDGTGSGFDSPSDIMLDHEGNVYVTGRSWASRDNYDYATIKYTPDGNEQWIARYDSPRQGYDAPVAMAIDKNRNVYVTGKSQKQDFYDIATVKYNSRGEEEWIAEYAGPADAVGVVSDDSGNVYVAGNSHDDYLIAKYNANGAEQWIASFDGISHGLDQAAAIGIDPYGNVYVTGKSQSLTASDIATIKIDSKGTQQWTARHTLSADYYCRISGMAVDDSGSAYVTATVANLQAYWDVSAVTFKYDTDGREEWSAIVDTAIAPAGVALDDSGNVYMATVAQDWIFEFPCCERFGVCKFNPRGEKKWRAIYDNGFDSSVSDLAVDGQGNVYLFGTTQCCGDMISFIDYLTVKFNPDGSVGWFAQYEKKNYDYFIDHSAAMAVDKNGNVYVTGDSWFPDLLAYTTIKYAAESIVSVPDKRNDLPTAFQLQQNYPNPFNATTNIRYILPVASFVTLEIHNLMGQKVRVLIAQRQQAGSHQAQWDGADEFGESVPSGVYMYRLRAGDRTEARKLLLLR